MVASLAIECHLPKWPIRNTKVDLQSSRRLWLTHCGQQRQRQRRNT
jgi:hypothetical protein